MPAFAEPDVTSEIGINTRGFAAAPGQRVAFRTVDPETDPALAANSAVSMSFRFTSQRPYHMFFGVEAEAGFLATPGSNLAGAYGLAGMRVPLARTSALSAEVALGRRWIRWGLADDDRGTTVVEPRARIDFGVGRKLSLGVAIGGTLGERDVWMAGIYAGIHSLELR